MTTPSEHSPATVRPFPELDFSKGWRYPPGPGDPSWEALSWLDDYISTNGRPLTEEDLALLRQPLFKVLKP